MCYVYHLLYRWHKIFKWNIWSMMSPYWNKFFFAMILILIVLFLGKCSCKIIMSSLHTNTFTGVFTFNVICPVIFIPFPLYFAHLFRCLERSQEVFSRGGLKRFPAAAQLFRPCAHDALQGPEESVPLWILPRSLAVSVSGAVLTPLLYTFRIINTYASEKNRMFDTRHLQGRSICQLLGQLQ